ncbi:MAG: hypothetical protein CME61_09490 [Halobacteriovoraceae bacterium]|nr:hypothetical protein [Halobacteriovoraceae bacterium]
MISLDDERLSSLAPCQRKALELINKGFNVCLHGPGGTGKSYLISKLVEIYGDGAVLVTATTGTAAQNIGGYTLHSVLGIPVSNILSKKLSSLDESKTEVLRHEKVKILVVDEMSMLTPSMFFYIYKRIKNLSRKTPNYPAKHLQVVLVGDLLQCPPVMSSKDKAESEKVFGDQNFFKMIEFEEMNFRHVKLQQIHRQNEEEEQFKKCLQILRRGGGTGPKAKAYVKAAIDHLNKHCFDNGSSETVDDKTVFLCPVNKIVDSYNDKVYNASSEKEVIFTGQSANIFPEKDYIVPEFLKLKKGMQVMTLVNDQYGRWVNGSVGEITTCDFNICTVRFGQHSEYNIEPHKWENKEPFVEKNEEGEEVIKERIIGTYEQIPIRICYALTGFKAQGKTLERVSIDLYGDQKKNAWNFCRSTPCLLYVMLSRATSIKKLRLEHPLSVSDVKTDKRLLHWLEGLDYD